MELNAPGLISTHGRGKTRALILCPGDDFGVVSGRRDEAVSEVGSQISYAFEQGVGAGLDFVPAHVWDPPADDSANISLEDPDALPDPLLARFVEHLHAKTNAQA